MSSASKEPAASSVVTEEVEPSKELPDKLAEFGVAAPDAAALPPRMPALGLGRVMSKLEGGRVEVRLGGDDHVALVDPLLHPAVLETAMTRSEPVIVEDRGGALYVVGALRTQPTPGVDAMSTVTIEADRIELKAKEEIAMSSGVAAIAVRAIGEVETYAERILSRAESVHKIIGRMLRLN